MPGKYWYAAMSFVYGAGGKIAEQQGGKWAGDAGELAGAAGSGRVAEADHQVLGRRRHQGRVRPGRDHGPGPHRRDPRQRLGGRRGDRPEDRQAGAGRRRWPPSRCPATTAGQYTPSFLGGSDLAVPAKAPNAGLGAEWIKYYTDTTSQTALAKFAIPNTTSLLSVYEAAGAGEQVHRRGGQEHLVRAEHAELGQRRERQHPAEHAGVDRDRQELASPTRPRRRTPRSPRPSTPNS